MEDINRIKIVQVGKNNTSKRESERMDMNPITFSKPHTNSFLFSNLLKIADFLDVDIKTFCYRV